MRFTPKLTSDYLNSLRTLIEKESCDGADRLVRALRAVRPDQDSGPSVAYLASCSVLADLIEQGWELAIQTDGIDLTRPDSAATAGETHHDAKERLRGRLLQERNRQLHQRSVREFLRSMERSRLFRGRMVSVLDLIDDGWNLAQQIQLALVAPPIEQEAALASIVSPAIVVCSEKQRCPHTGLLLRDVWRYFRHTWSLPYRSVPGRSVSLLIRNAARPLAPIIGLAMLASAPPRLAPRDVWIGWDVNSLRARIQDGVWGAGEVYGVLTSALGSAIEELRSDDLITPDAVINPTAATVRSLHQLAADAHNKRNESLLSPEGASQRSLPRDQSGNIDWVRASGRPLFKRKRAASLARLLQARRRFRTFDDDVPLSERLLSLFSTEAGRSSVRTVLQEIRNRAVNRYIADVSVCGAIAPYNELLGGKLVALLMATAEVQSIFVERYAEHISIIASQMAGRPIHRVPNLLFLTTTSLYGVGSSQYNRLHLRAAHHAELKNDIAWERLDDLSQGYGTLHLSKQTVDALRMVSLQNRGVRQVNNVFGEGTSPRLRQVREGAYELGLESDEILRHGNRRLVYVCPLVPDARERLVGLRSNISLASLPSVEAISTAWRRRWLLGRVNRPEILRRITHLGPNTVKAQLHLGSTDQLSLSLEP